MQHDTQKAPESDVSAVITTEEIWAEPTVIASVTIRMPMTHAETLQEVLRYIAGKPSGPRGHCDAIRDALCEARVARPQLSMRGRLFVENL